MTATLIEYLSWIARYAREGRIESDANSRRCNIDFFCCVGRHAPEEFRMRFYRVRILWAWLSGNLKPWWPGESM